MQFGTHSRRFGICLFNLCLRKMFIGSMSKNRLNTLCTHRLSNSKLVSMLTFGGVFALALSSAPVLAINSECYREYVSTGAEIMVTVSTVYRTAGA